jgi:hypothetical protein
MAEETESGEPDFTQKELEERFKVKWFSPKKAHQKLLEQNPDRYMPRFITERDLNFLENSVLVEKRKRYKLI